MISKITKIGIFAALSAVFMIFIQFPIMPSAPFLKYDPSDIPALIISFALGPFSAVAVVAIKEILFILFKASAHDIIGVPMDFIASGSFVFISGFIYHKKKTKLNAVFSLVVGFFSMTFIMTLLNYFVIPLYMKIFIPDFNISKEALLKIIILGVIPFNMVKGILNSALTFLIYKNISSKLH